jgi:hypothetical protein
MRKATSPEPRPAAPSARRGDRQEGQPAAGQPHRRSLPPRPASAEPAGRVGRHFFGSAGGRQPAGGGWIGDPAAGDPSLSRGCVPHRSGRQPRLSRARRRPAPDAARGRKGSRPPDPAPQAPRPRPASAEPAGRVGAASSAAAAQCAAGPEARGHDRRAGLSVLRQRTSGRSDPRPRIGRGSWAGSPLARHRSPARADGPVARCDAPVFGRRGGAPRHLSSRGSPGPDRRGRGGSALPPREYGRKAGRLTPPGLEGGRSFRTGPDAHSCHQR